MSKGRLHSCQLVAQSHRELFFLKVRDDAGSGDCSRLHGDGGGHGSGLQQIADSAFHACNSKRAPIRHSSALAG